mmetsp:Transcript_4923/g.14946  ORF Transcript_4923/g.14946 Transcript_4923/m.14946 type:complete len:244 (+) Transcript_4923:128-859(+)
MTYCGFRGCVPPRTHDTVSHAKGEMCGPANLRWQLSARAVIKTTWHVSKLHSLNRMCTSHWPQIGSCHELVRSFLEARRLWVEAGILYELEKEVCEPFAQSRERRFSPPTIEHIRFAINKLSDVARERTVKFLDCPFHVQQHIQPLVYAKMRKTQAVVQLHQLLCTRGEGRVDLRDIAITQLPLLGCGHLLQHGTNATVTRLAVCLKFQSVDGLQQLLLLEKECVELGLAHRFRTLVDPCRFL